MKSAAETLEDRIRERAYYLWEASGRPSGREVEFWHRACEMVATDDDQPKSGRKGVNQGRRNRSRRASVPARHSGQRRKWHRSRPVDWARPG